MVLFLFVIMLLNLQRRSERGTAPLRLRGLGLWLGVAVPARVGCATCVRGRRAAPDPGAAAGGLRQHRGGRAEPLHATSCCRSRSPSLLLLVAVVGAVVLAQAQDDRMTDRPDRCVLHASAPCCSPSASSACWCAATSSSSSCAIELMLNAVNLAFVAFARSCTSIDGQVIVFFVMTVAAAEAAVGLGDHHRGLPQPRDRQRRRAEAAALVRPNARRRDSLAISG